eukprot:350981-Chlamydomonas_euryale.AAC.5
MKLTDRHRLETIREQCGTSSLELMVDRRNRQWMGHVLRIDEDRLPRQVDCALARSAIRGCHEEGSVGGTTFRDFLTLPGHTTLIPWPEVRAAAAERALNGQARRDAIKNLAPLALRNPQKVGRMTWSCARCGGSGYCCSTVPSVQPFLACNRS